MLLPAHILMMPVLLVYQIVSGNLDRSLNTGLKANIVRIDN